MFAYFLLYLRFCVIYFILHPVVFVPPGFIRFALIRSFSYSFGATGFDDCQFFFFFLHLNILQVCNFILGLLRKFLSGHALL